MPTFKWTGSVDRSVVDIVEITFTTDVDKDDIWELIDDITDQFYSGGGIDIEDAFDVNFKVFKSVTGKVEADYRNGEEVEISV